MKSRMLFNAFAMNCIVYQSPGLWTRPDDRMVDYKDLEQWTELAKLIERGCFDGIFLADVFGTYDVYGGTRDASVRSAAQFPVNDPMLLVPAMAAVTEHLGFGFTASILQYHPFVFARLISTLDHLTKGRIAWNIVTSYLSSTARSLGQDAIPGHDERYEMADEFCEVCYRLWAESWADDAVVADRARGVYAEPERVRDIEYVGRWYKCNGCHLSEPSPQRVPLLYQAGTSPRGTDFAARHAEAVFLIGSKPEVNGQYVCTLREKLVAAGRDPSDLRTFAYMKVITGSTEEEARRKYDEFEGQISYDGALALLCGWSGLDLSKYEPDQPVEYIETDAVRTFLHSFTAGDPARTWTMRDIAHYVGIGGAGPVVVGAPEQVADALELWVDAGVDGFNLAYSTLPGSFVDFIEGVVPVLQKRGRMQTEYRPGTLREKLFPGRGARLAAPHPAAAGRGFDTHRRRA